MIYIFVEEDLQAGGEDSIFRLQAEYARQSGEFALCSLRDRSVSAGACPDSEPVFLRAACPSMYEAMSLLEEKGFRLIEDAASVSAIEHWDSLGLADRHILPVTVSQILAGELNDSMLRLLKDVPAVFLKSRAKGFHARIASERLAKPDGELTAFLRSRASVGEQELMMSRWLEVRRDSLGRRESRHIVIGGRVMNSSRTLRAVRHSVPASHRKKAEDTAELIRGIKAFPQNYALDITEFLRDDGTVVTDISEINPITCSHCYVNNSIFARDIEAVVPLRAKTGMGAEYCFDMLKRPDSYVMARSSNENFEYTADQSYEFM